MVNIKEILAVCIVLVILQNVENRRKFRTVYFLNTTRDFNPKYFKYVNVVINQDNTSMSIFLESKLNITQIWSAATISVWQKSSRAFRTIATYGTDVCETLQRVKYIKLDIFNKWVTNLMKYSNISANCPYPKNVYYISNMKVDKSSIPDFAPSGKFHTYLMLYNKGENGLKENMVTTELILEVK